MRHSTFLRWVLATVAVLLLTLGAVAQTALGTISGRIQDPNQAVIVDAKITITNLATNVSTKVTTTQTGLYSAPNLAAGNYKVIVEQAGFRRSERIVVLEIAQNVECNFEMQVGSSGEVVEVSGQTATVNTTTADVSREITPAELQAMPLLTRNAYALVALAPGAVDTGNSNGDISGIGISVAGARTRSINFLLDGSENNETFATGPSTIVPVDAIQEFRVQTNSMTAEFGRNTLQANVVTKSGTNSFHGSAYEYYRGSALSTWPVQWKAEGLDSKPRYVRNVFGFSVGGPIIKDKTFFFGAMEGIRVRSNGSNFWYVPTQQFYDAASSNMQAYLDAGGGIPKANLSQTITADQILAKEGDPTVTSLYTASGLPIPGSTPLFQRTRTMVPIDNGGGVAQNTWSVTTRVDHQFSDRTGLSGRWAWYRQIQPVGASSDSPFTAFQTDYSFRSQNGTLSLTHSWTPTLFSETRVTYSRTFPNAPLGQGAVTVPCVQYDLLRNFGDTIAFPGYLPASCNGFAIPTGGPQNTYSAYTGFTWNRGKHTFKWGGYARHLRDNHTFGAYANAYLDVLTMQNMLNGVVDGYFSLGIDPKGKVPGETYNVATDGALGPPNFTRHYRYNETALYFEDVWRLTPRITVTPGLRWEYFGVLHSPGAERFLDANLYLDMTGTPAALTPGGKSIFQQIADARFTRTGNFYNQDWNDFGPRLALAWDVFGNGRTVFRSGYGIFYDANFGNALFNAIQNPPNYAVLAVTPMADVPNTGLILPNQYDSLASLMGGTGSFPVKSSARMLNREMVTAYSQQWNATLEHDIFGKGMFASVAYVGAKGDKLYSLNNLNQRGSCYMLGEAYCNAAPQGLLARLNQTGLTGMNRRANEGWSRYHSMQLQLRTAEIPKTGLQLSANYTWAHSIDNASSFFSDAYWESNWYGVGFTYPYDPSYDKADSTNDVRHRFAVSYSWAIPWSRNLKGVTGTVLGDWKVAGIYTAQTGTPFSIYEISSTDPCTGSFTNFCYPVLAGALPRRLSASQAVGPDNPNRLLLYDTSGSFMGLDQYCNYDDLCMDKALYTTGNIFLHRNALRAPGIWNTDFAVMKDFAMPGEKMKLQFRAEFFNLFNHSNLYVDPNSLTSDPGGVWAARGVPVSSQLGTPYERRNIQFALRLMF